MMSGRGRRLSLSMELGELNLNQFLKARGELWAMSLHRRASCRWAR